AEWQRNIRIGEARGFDRDELAIRFRTARLCARPVRFDARLGPDDDDRAGRGQFAHDLVAICLAGAQVAIPPDAPAFRLEKRRQLERERVVCFGIADEDVGHGACGICECPAALVYLEIVARLNPTASPIRPPLSNSSHDLCLRAVISYRPPFTC